MNAGPAPADGGGSNNSTNMGFPVSQLAKEPLDVASAKYVRFLMQMTSMATSSLARAVRHPGVFCNNLGFKTNIFPRHPRRLNSHGRLYPEGRTIFQLENHAFQPVDEALK